MKMKHSVLALVLFGSAFAMTPATALARPLLSPCQSTAAGGTTQTNSTDILPQAPIDREIKRGDTHSYRIALAADQYLQVSVEQVSINLLVRVSGPRERLLEVDSELLIGKTERVFLVAESEGEYRFELLPAGGLKASGSYRIAVEALRPAAGEDRKRFAAQKSFTEAIQLQGRGGADDLRSAIDRYQTSLAFWKTLNDSKQQARTLNHIGLAYASLKDYQTAIDHYTDSLPLWRYAGDHSGEASALHSIGALYSMSGKHQRGVEYLEKALQILRTLNDQESLINALHAIANAYERMADYKNALEFDNQKLQLVRSLGDRKAEAVSLHNIGVVYYNLADYQKSLEYYTQALPIRLEVGDRDGEASTMSAIGLVHSTQGDSLRALEFYERALSIWHEAGNKQGEGLVLHNIGAAYSYMGDRQMGLDYFGRALKLRRELRDRFGEAQTLNQIANAYAGLGDYDRAVETYHLALPIRREAGDRRGEAYTLNGLANTCLAQGNNQDALEYANQAAAIFRTIGDKDGLPAALANIGRVHSALGDHRKALEYYDQALPLFRAIGSRRLEADTVDRAGAAYLALGDIEKAFESHSRALTLSRDVQAATIEARSLAALAHVESRRGNFAQARLDMESALAKIERLRSRVQRQDLRSTFLASVQDAYEFYIGLLMRLEAGQQSERNAAAALEASEKARARSLIETLAEARVDIRQGVDPELLKQERAAQRQLNARSEALTRLLGGVHTDQQAETARKDLESAITEYQDTQARIRANSPRYAALTEPQPLTVGEIQAQLDSNTLLPEYSLGDDRSYLWAVSPTSIRTFELPSRAAIESASRRFHDLIALGNRPEVSVQVKLAGVELSRMILGPVARRLEGKRLLIVASGALQYVPFAALPAPSVIDTARPGDIAGQGGSSANPAQSGGTRTFTPLVVEHEIVNLPSVSVLAVLRKETARRPPSRGTVAVLADPVLESSVPRVNRPASADSRTSAESPSASRPPADLVRSLGDTGPVVFDRLSYTRVEAKAISEFAPRDKSLEALDFDASRARATSAELGDYRIVHFATHGLVNSQHPELSGMVLSLVDEHGRPQDGFLRLTDVYNLKLGADLVVLSACRTALGKDVKGEGLVGITRGFMYAGAPRVVASLWDVKDVATAELMKRFYRQMLQKGLPPAAALREAQISMLREPRWQAPYYWAGFELLGEWR
ncbi:MAG TPA: tetratricopeptide repeat protein [Blastocatellia bacterium]|nr:tetratricopeptide repeat protein [Blastocatellia bacterium]